LTDPVCQSDAKLAQALVVAVKHKVGCRDSTGAGNVVLTTCRDIESHPLLMGKPGHRGAEERFRRVNSTASKACNYFPAPATEMFFVVYEQRRPELAGETQRRDPAQIQLAVVGDRGIVG
jgi:hypothetical protein